MKFLLLSSSGQSSCLESLISEIKTRGYSYLHISDTRYLDNPSELKKLHSEMFDAVIMTDTKFKKYSFFSGLKKPLITTVHHGVGIKFAENYLDSYFNTPSVDLVFVPGKIYFETLIRHKNRKADVYMTGFPKTDYLVNNYKKPGKFREELNIKFNLDRSKKLILYAPTWSRHSYSYGTLSSFPHIQEVLKDYCVIVAPHPSDFNWVKSELKPRNYDNVGYFLEPNKNKLILGSDVILSDNSSIAFEAAIINKPIIHLINEYAPETMNLYLNPKSKKVSLGPILKYPKDLNLLPKYIETALYNKSEDMTKNYWITKFAAGCNGVSTQQVLDIIESKVSLRKDK